MSDFLVIRGWTGRQRIPVEIIGETPEGFRIKALERVLLPGRGILEIGQSAIVSKSVIKLAEGNEPRDNLIANARAPFYARALRFLANLRKAFHKDVMQK
jgi:hypothetical protein